MVNVKLWPQNQRARRTDDFKATVNKYTENLGWGGLGGSDYPVFL